MSQEKEEAYHNIEDKECQIIDSDDLNSDEDEEMSELEEDHLRKNKVNHKGGEVEEDGQKRGGEVEEDRQKREDDKDKDRVELNEGDALEDHTRENELVHMDGDAMKENEHMREDNKKNKREDSHQSEEEEDCNGKKI